MKSTKSFAIVLILLSMVSCTTGKEFDFDNSKLTIESLVKQYNLELAEQIISSDSLHPLSLKEMKETYNHSIIFIIIVLFRLYYFLLHPINQNRNS